MSGVYIKGLKMPTDFSGTRLIIYPNGQVLFPHRTYFDELHGVEAIPVPDHGRLVDADALQNDGWVLHKQVMRLGGYAIHEMPLSYPSIPTIIPASKEADT